MNNIQVTTTHYENDGTGEWIATRLELEQVTELHEKNVIESFDFFRSLGGHEEYKNGVYISTSPDGMRRTTRSYKFKGGQS